MTQRQARPATLDAIELRAYVPHLWAGARALRERERWAARISFLPVTATEAAEDAEALEALAAHLDRAGAS